MPDWPHEYTVRAWRPDLETKFNAMCDLIRATGTARPWPPPPARAIYNNHYLALDDYEYWAMGDDGDRGPVRGLTVINRRRNNMER
jgi:hypothetical protein